MAQSAGESCRILWQHICRRVRLLRRVSRIWLKQSYSEAPVMLELWGMRSILSLPLLPGPIWLGIVATDRVLSMGQLGLNCVITLSWIVWNWMFYIELLNQLIGLVGRVFANGPGDLGSISGRVIPKTLKMVFDTLLLNTQQYKVRIKGKVEQSRERSSALSYSRCSSYWKGSLLVALNYSRQLYFLLTYI